MATLGDAFINVHADLSPFRREVKAAMARMSKDVEQDVDRQGNAIGRRLGQKIREGMASGLGTTRISRDAVIDLETRLDKTSAAQTEAAVKVLTRDREIDVKVDRRAVDQIEGLNNVISRMFQRTFNILDRLFSSAINIGERIPGAGFGIGAVIIAALVEIIGLVGFVTEALLGLASTLPLIGLVGAASIAPLVLIFSNLGDAFSTLSGDAEEFRVAISTLGRDTRFVFRQMRESVLFFLDIREAVQENFFGPIRDAIEDLDTGALSTVFAAGFGGVASGAGRMVASFIELFDHPEAARFFQDVFRLAELTFDEVGGAVIDLIGAFTNMADETIPDVERGLRDIGDIISGWADSLNEFVDSGEFREWLDEAERKLRVITGLLSAAWDTIRTVVAQTSEDVEDILTRLTGLFEDLNAFFQSETGETVLEGMRITLELISVLLLGILAIFGGIFFIIGTIGRLIDGTILGNMEGIKALAEEITGIFQGIEFNILGWETNLAAVVALITFMISPITTIGLLVFNLIRNWETVGIRIAGALELALGLAQATSGDLVGAAIRLKSGWDRVSGAVDNANQKASNLKGNTGTTSSFLASARDRAYQLRDALAQAAANSSRIRTGGATGGRNILVADGGIFTTMQNVTIAEAGPEVVIPLTRPNRARELIEATNLMDLVQGGDGATQFGGARGTSGLGSAPEIHLTFVSDGTRAGDTVLELMRHAVRIRGGDVQTVVGRNG